MPLINTIRVYFATKTSSLRFNWKLEYMFKCVKKNISRYRHMTRIAGYCILKNIVLPHVAMITRNYDILIFVNPWNPNKWRSSWCKYNYCQAPKMLRITVVSNKKKNGRFEKSTHKDTFFVNSRVTMLDHFTCNDPINLINA